MCKAEDRAAACRQLYIVEYVELFKSWCLHHFSNLDCILRIYVSVGRMSEFSGWLTPGNDTGEGSISRWLKQKKQFLEKTVFVILRTTGAR